MYELFRCVVGVWHPTVWYSCKFCLVFDCMSGEAIEVILGKARELHGRLHRRTGAKKLGGCPTKQNFPAKLWKLSKKYCLDTLPYCLAFFTIVLHISCFSIYYPHFSQPTFNIRPTYVQNLPKLWTVQSFGGRGEAAVPFHSVSYPQWQIDC